MIVFALIVLAIAHLAFGVRLLRALRQQQKSDSTIENTRVMVVMCLRGSDPYLKKTLRSLGQLDHPNYFVRLIVDSVADPSLAVAREITDELPKGMLEISILKHRLTTCSLKCSALVQALQDIPRNVGFVATIDSDADPQKDWLSSLLRPMVNPKVVATSGYRWFQPDTTSFGAHVRFVWNFFATAQMVALSIPWGGSMALRCRFITESGYLGKISNCFCEDTILHELAENHGKIVRYAPTVTINNETCNVRDLLPWISRQLLCVSLYHPAWRVVVLLASVQLIVYTAAIAAIWVYIVREDWASLCTIGGVQLLSATVVLANGFVVDRFMSRSRKPLGFKKRMRDALLNCLALLFLQLAYPFVVFRTLAMKQVSWRGIAYDIASDKSIHMKAYHTYPSIRKDAPQATGQRPLRSAARESIY